MRWREKLEALIRWLDEHDPERRFSFSDELAKEFERLREDFRDTFVREVLGEEKIEEALEWLSQFKKLCEEVKRIYGLSEIVLSRELQRFVRDPILHIKHSINFYLFDVLRRHITIEQFWTSASAAVRTAHRTNERACYERWVFLVLLKHLGESGASLVYPESRALMLTRTGKQKLATIPPDAIVELPDGRRVSLFLEAPRPITWGDTYELRFVWSLYRIARPDIMAYGGNVTDILQLGKEPPVKRPDVIIEIKVLHEWWKRRRLLRVFSKPLSIEKWRSMWLRGLYNGLANILGLKRRVSETETKSGVYASDVDVLKMYLEIYQPRAGLFVVSRVPVSESVREELESMGIRVLDDVGFDDDALRPISRILMDIAAPADRISKFLGALFRALSRRGFRGLSRDTLIELALRFALAREKDFIAWLRGCELEGSSPSNLLEC